MRSFTTLAAPSQHQEIVKNSSFIAYASRADNPREAAVFLQAVVQRHPDASHLCWAYRIAGEYRFSDGGEPGGTAGQPILRAIEGQNLDHVVVGVIRYFGGTKLGTGGLVRAYGGTAAEALRQAERKIESPRILLVAEVAFEHMGSLYRLLDGAEADRGGEEYTERGVRILFSLESDKLESLSAVLRDATRGEFSLGPVP